MRIQRILPPAAAPINMVNILGGIKGLVQEDSKLKRFLSELKNYFDVEYCFLFSSGKAALLSALMALKKIAPGRTEAIMPAYVCYSVPSAVVRAGLKVIPCDMGEKSLEMDPQKLKKKITEKTLCVIVPHLFGVPAQISKIIDLCSQAGVMVIEDAAQTFGSKNEDNKLLGTQADIGFFSLGRGKSLTTVEGGILITKKESLGKTINEEYNKLDSYSLLEKVFLLLKATFIWTFLRPNLYWFPTLFAFLKLGDTSFTPKFSLKKMSGVQAGLTWGWKAQMESFNKKRSEHTMVLSEHFSKNQKFLIYTENRVKTSCLRLPVFIKDLQHKKSILTSSVQEGFGIKPTFPKPINEIDEIKSMLSHQEYPIAKKMADHMLTFPVHPLVSNNDIEKIYTKIIK